MFGNNPLPNIGPITFCLLTTTTLRRRRSRAPIWAKRGVLVTAQLHHVITATTTTCISCHITPRAHHPLLSTATSHPTTATALVDCHLTPRAHHCSCQLPRHTLPCPTLSSAAMSPAAFAPAAMSHTTTTPIDDTTTHTRYLAPPLIKGCGQYVFARSSGWY